MIEKRVPIMILANADGVSEQFTVDLNTDPYWVGEDSVHGFGGRMHNWFTDGVPGKGEPTGVIVGSGAISATLANAVLTINVPVKPDGEKYEVMLFLLFRPITKSTLPAGGPPITHRATK